MFTASHCECWILEMWRRSCCSQQPQEQRLQVTLCITILADIHREFVRETRVATRDPLAQIDNSPLLETARVGIAKTKEVETRKDTGSFGLPNRVWFQSLLEALLLQVLAG